MQVIALALVLASQATGTTADPPHEPRATYKTLKSIPALQTCLTKKLTRIGDVTDLTVDGVTTLMIREAPNEPVMLIDLAPASVTVTTNFLYGTRKLVEACL